MKIVLAILGLLCGLATPAWAQREFATWCFGNGPTQSLVPNGPQVGFGVIKIAFGVAGPGPPVYWQGVNTPAFNDGNATISDAEGNLRFASTGFSLVDTTRAVMAGGYLNGVYQSGSPIGYEKWWLSDPNLQSTAIAPAPGNDHDDYAFYWNKAENQGQLAFALSWVRVDIRLNGGRGGVAERGQLLPLTRSAKLTIVRHQNNRDYWVITRDLDTRGFVAFLLSPMGVSATPVVSLAGQAQYPGLGELKAAPNGRRLACGGLRRTGSTGEALLCLYDFDNATGIVSHEVVGRRVPVARMTATADGRPLSLEDALMYNCSFSPDSRLLYTVEYAAATPRRLGDVWQYDVSQASPDAIAASRFWVSNAPLPADPRDIVYCMGLQLAPDGTLWVGQFYYSYQNPSAPTSQWRPITAALVRYPNVAGAGCRFIAQHYPYLPGQFPGVALPNVITNMLYAPAALNYEAACPEDSVQFWASSAGAPAALRWDFGEPASGAANQATGRLAAHRYQQDGTYPVRLTLADGRVLTQAVTVAGAAADFTHQNVFTPNADGLNDAFRPVRQPLPGGRLRVYSRWGALVFSSDDPALRWDGAGAAAGEYLYQLDYPDCRGTLRRQRGPLTLVR
ncbi:gliding motility-associated-like protein [Hymenobacter sp. UYAg731]